MVSEPNRDIVTIGRTSGLTLTETRQTYDRFIGEGYSGKKAKELIGSVVTSEIFDVLKKQVLAVGKYKKTVAARSLLCFWATCELGISLSKLNQKLKVLQPAVSL